VGRTTRASPKKKPPLPVALELLAVGRVSSEPGSAEIPVSGTFTGNLPAVRLPLVLDLRGKQVLARPSRRVAHL
jgi:hypothetical protein